MKETYEFLKKAEVNYLATLDGNRPSLRPFGVPVVNDNRIYVLTNRKKKVSHQLALNPAVCIVAYTGEKWIRIRCQLIDDSDNKSVKQQFLTTFPDLQEAGYSLDNPNMQVLYMDQAHAVIYDEDGNEQETHQF